MRKKNELNLAVDENSPALAVDLPRIGARASAAFDDKGNACVSLQDKRGVLTMTINFDNAHGATKTKTSARTRETSEPEKKRYRRRSKELKALANMKTHIASGKPLPSTTLLAKSWKTTPVTVERWLTNWRKDGEIPRGIKMATKRKRTKTKRMLDHRPAARRRNLPALNGHSPVAGRA